MKNNEGRELELLKNQIGFKTAFKATLGFYTGQFVATLLGLLFIGTVVASGYLFYWLMNL